MSGPTVHAVGIGADGWDGMPEPRRALIRRAALTVGAPRQIGLLGPVADEIATVTLPAPPAGLFELLADRADGELVCVLGSGDPMLHGIGAVLARRLPADRLVVHPDVSSFALACAEMRWPQAEVTLLSTVAAPLAAVARELAPERRMVVFVPGAGGAAALAGLLCARGYGPSRFTVLESLGGPDARRTDTTAEAWGERTAGPLHLVALACLPAPGSRPLPRGPGLPDDAFDHDGQLTKRPVRAVTLAMLEPRPGALLWDVGAGSGAIGIEWLRACPQARAVAVEADPERAARARANAERLGVPELVVRDGAAPAALAGLAPPDAVFIGGGLTGTGVLDACASAVAGRAGTVLVANAVTLEGEAVLTGARARWGGELTRIELAHAGPVGGLTAWRAKLPIVQWVLSS